MREKIERAKALTTTLGMMRNSFYNRKVARGHEALEIMIYASEFNARLELRLRRKRPQNLSTFGGILSPRIPLSSPYAPSLGMHVGRMIANQISTSD